MKRTSINIRKYLPSPKPEAKIPGFGGKLLIEESLNPRLESIDEVHQTEVVVNYSVVQADEVNESLTKATKIFR